MGGNKGKNPVYSNIFNAFVEVMLMSSFELIMGLNVCVCKCILVFSVEMDVLSMAKLKGEN